MSRFPLLRALLILITAGSISGLWHMATGAISTCNLSGPLGIAGASGDDDDTGFSLRAEIRMRR